MQYTEVFNINCILHVPHEIDAHHTSRQPVDFFYPILVSRWVRLWWARTCDFLDQRINWSICRKYTSSLLLLRDESEKIAKELCICKQMSFVIVFIDALNPHRNYFTTVDAPNKRLLYTQNVDDAAILHERAQIFIAGHPIHDGRMELLWVNVIKKNPIIEPWIERRKLQHSRSHCVCTRQHSLWPTRQSSVRQ